VGATDAKTDAKKDKHAGDLVSVEQYENFELRIDWRLLPGGDGGITYNVAESAAKAGRGIGFEYQILDDDGHPDARMGAGGNRTAGALYDLVPPKKRAARPIGEWNQARVVVDGARVEHWLNGTKVVEFERSGVALMALIARSQWRTTVGFGKNQRGHVVLRDQGHEVWFRNIKVRRIVAR
jgi:hypothetical protein